MPKSPFDSLVRDGVLTREALASATKDSPAKRKSIGWLLVNDHGVPLEAVGKALSAFYGVPFEGYREGRQLPEELCGRLSLDLWIYHLAAPIAREDDRVVLWMADPGDLPRKDYLENRFGEPFSIRVGLEEDIRQALTALLTLPEHLSGCLDGEPEEEMSVDAVEEVESPAIGVLNGILTTCLQQKGEEIRFDPRESPAAAWRVAGAWRELPVPAALLQSLVRRVKVMSNLDIGNRAKPQNGFFQLQLFKSRARFDVAIEPIGGGDEAARVVPRP